jgi:hypothetical protein
MMGIPLNCGLAIAAGPRAGKEDIKKIAYDVPEHVGRAILPVPTGD